MCSSTAVHGRPLESAGLAALLAVLRSPSTEPRSPALAVLDRSSRRRARPVPLTPNGPLIAHLADKERDPWRTVVVGV